jgi:hypothetical protein
MSFYQPKVSRCQAKKLGDDEGPDRDLMIRAQLNPGSAGNSRTAPEP